MSPGPCAPRPWHDRPPDGLPHAATCPAPTEGNAPEPRCPEHLRDRVPQEERGRAYDCPSRTAIRARHPDRALTVTLPGGAEYGHEETTAGGGRREAGGGSRGRGWTHDASGRCWTTRRPTPPCTPRPAPGSTCPWPCPALTRVADDGPGIPAEGRERVLDRFHRVRRARSRGRASADRASRSPGPGPGARRRDRAGHRRAVAGGPHRTAPPSTGRAPPTADALPDSGSYGPVTCGAWSGLRAGARA
ncbi:hypothetical protein APS67_003840 [Streptomyces sp. AVP053U2]|nr:hypothetical protein APS67_003840 [Streptomyces sp. AVP053U2]